MRAIEISIEIEIEIEIEIVGHTYCYLFRVLYECSPMYIVYYFLSSCQSIYLELVLCLYGTHIISIIHVY